MKTVEERGVKMVGEKGRREDTSFHRNLSPLRILDQRLTLPSSASSPSSFASSPSTSPTFSALDFTSSPSSSSCPSTPLSYFLSKHTTDQLPSFQESLIPGLPDDLAIACLRRLPLACQAVGRCVCRRWQAAFSSDEYIQARRNTGLAEPWLLVLAFHKVTGKIQWQALDPVRQSWHVIPPMPCKERVCPPGFGCVANAEEGALFVCGGMRSDMDCPMDTVLKYELNKNRWMVMEPMSTPRSFFASGMIDGRIYAAGGNSTDSYELSSAEVFDPAEEKWRPVASMGTNMARYDAAVLNGKLLVTEGWSWPFLSPPRGQIYDPQQDRWESMMVGMREGWTGLSVVLDSHLYIISEHDSSKLKVYDKEADSWKNVVGAPMPSHMMLPFSVNTINGKLLVVARNLNVAVGTVSHSLDEDGKPIISVEWQGIYAPDIFTDFVPSHSLVLYA